MYSKLPDPVGPAPAANERAALNTCDRVLSLWLLLAASSSARHIDASGTAPPHASGETSRASRNPANIQRWCG